MPFWRRGRQFPPSLPQYNFLNIKLMFKVANWNATGHWGPTHQWLPAILSSIHLFFPEDTSQFSEVTFSGGLRRLTTLLHSLFRNCPCDTINLPPYYSLSTSFLPTAGEDDRPDSEKQTSYGPCKLSHFQFANWLFWMCLKGSFLSFLNVRFSKSPV